MKHMLLILSALTILTTSANAQLFWSDNFDSYVPGSLISQSTWECWNGGTATDADVVTSPALSLPNSVKILRTSDVVQIFSGATYGQWVITGWCYIPCSSTGQQFWIMLNTYSHNGTQNWSCQVLFDSDVGQVQDYDGTGALPIICDQWVELKVEIDLDMNYQTVYYNNQVLFTDSWTEHASGGGAAQIECLDLFSNGGTAIYWDDLVLLGPGAIPVEESSWGKVKSLYR